MFRVAASMALTPASRAALSAALSPTTGEPLEKLIVLPSWMGTGAGIAVRAVPKRDPYAQKAAAVAAAAARTEARRRGLTQRTVGHSAGVRNITHR